MSEKETRIIDGVSVEVYADEHGNIRRADNSRFVAPAPGFKITTSERGRELNARRYALAQERAVQGMIAGFGLDLNRADGGEAWQEAVRVLVTQFAKSTNVRGMSETLITLGRATGFLSPDKSEPNSNEAELTRALIDYLKTRLPKQAPPLDAEVIDNDDNS